MLFNKYLWPDRVVCCVTTLWKGKIYRKPQETFLRWWPLHHYSNTCSNPSWLQDQLFRVAKTPLLILVCCDQAKHPMGISSPISSAGRGQRMPFLNGCGPNQLEERIFKRKSKLLLTTVQKRFLRLLKARTEHWEKRILLVLKKIPATKNNGYSSIQTKGPPKETKEGKRDE